jgi:glycosyltransferase involved in cell wall biosynthesis
MEDDRKPVLQVFFECSQELASVPLVAFNFYDQISRACPVLLVTSERNAPALEKVRGDRPVTYITESGPLQSYFRLVKRLTTRGAVNSVGGSVNWPLRHVLSYPVYAEFSRRVRRQFGERVRAGEFSAVHAMTPMMPRYPVSLARACTGRTTPFILGPVNGGVPFPPGFKAIARKEYAAFNLFRGLCRLLPGYTATYRGADRVLAGSQYTLTMLRETLQLADRRLLLFPENGVDPSFYVDAPAPLEPNEPLRLLFVGRLVPYKGADMLLAALSLLPADLRSRLCLTIVGDGSERGALEEQARALGPECPVSFTGWLPQLETARYYRSSHLFCFPSIREFGGTVVLEAMAAAVPSLVVDHGGIGEYVTAASGVKIAPRSRQYIVSELASQIGALARNPEKRARMAVAALARGREFAWPERARQMIALYAETRAERQP